MFGAGAIASSSFQAWANYRQVNILASEKMAYVTVPFVAGMNADYSDIRFCIDPSGTTAQKKFIQHRRISYDGSSALFSIGSATALPATIHYIWGNAEAEDTSDGYATHNTAAEFFNDFSRGVWWDVGKYLTYDKIPFLSAFWPAVAESPFDNVTACQVFKHGPEHLATDDTDVRFSKTADRGLTWSVEQTIFPFIDGNTLTPPINKRMVFMNCTVTWADDGTEHGIITAIANSNISSTGTPATGVENQTYSRAYIVQSTDSGATWTAPTLLIQTADYTGMGGSAIVTSDGLQLFFGHCDFPIAGGDPFCYCFYSFDNWVTPEFITYGLAGNYPNETTPLQKKDLTTGLWKKEVNLIIREEDFEDWLNATLTYDTTLQTVSIGVLTVNSVIETLKSRPNQKRYYMGYGRGDRIILMGGTSVITGWYSDDETATWTAFAIQGGTSVIGDGSSLGAGRTYPAQAVFRVFNHDIGMVAWNTNLTISDMYTQFFDPMLMQMRTINVGSYTVSVPRPVLSADGITISYNDTGVVADPKTLVAKWWTKNGFSTPFALEGKAKQVGACNVMMGLQKTGHSGETFTDILFVHAQNNVVYLEQANDGFNFARTVTDDTFYWFRFEWETTAIRVYFKINEGDAWTLAGTKSSAICNFLASPIINIRDQAGASDTLSFMQTLPIADITTTLGSSGAGSFILNTLEDGLL